MGIFLGWRFCNKKTPHEGVACGEVWNSFIPHLATVYLRRNFGLIVN
jgi:hypothetical protein